MKRQTGGSTTGSNAMKETTSIIVVDPQVGFCDPNGSLAAAYGASELEPIDRVMT